MQSDALLPPFQRDPTVILPTVINSVSDGLSSNLDGPMINQEVDGAPSASEMSVGSSSSVSPPTKIDPAVNSSASDCATAPPDGPTINQNVDGSPSSSDSSSGSSLVTPPEINISVDLNSTEQVMDELDEVINSLKK